MLLIIMFSLNSSNSLGNVLFIFCKYLIRSIAFLSMVVTFILDGNLTIRIRKFVRSMFHVIILNDYIVGPNGYGMKLKTNYYRIHLVIVFIP